VLWPENDDVWNGTIPRLSSNKPIISLINRLKTSFEYTVCKLYENFSFEIYCWNTFNILNKMGNIFKIVQQLSLEVSPEL